MWTKRYLWLILLPTRPADLLNETEVSIVSLHRAIRKVLRDGLAAAALTLEITAMARAKRGHNQDHLKVYGRGGKALRALWSPFGGHDCAGIRCSVKSARNRRM